MAGMFRRFIDRLHLGTSLYDIARTIAEHWAIVLSTVAAIATGGWAWWSYATQWGYLPVFVAALLVLAAAMTIFRNVISLRRENRPSRARLTFDYNYGIALDDIIPSHDVDNEQNCLEFRFQIRNVAPGPLKYNAERIDVIIDDRIRTGRNLSGSLPRTSWILLKVGGFRKSLVDTLQDRVTGRYEMMISYGHPAEGYSRQMKKNISFDLIKKDGRFSSAPWIIVSDEDVPISSHGS